MTTIKSRLAIVLVLIVVAAALRVTEANPAVAQTQEIGAWRVTSEPAMDGFAPEWQSIVPVFLPTTSQQTTQPMGGGSIERIAVRSVHHEGTLYVMLEWVDRTPDEVSDHYHGFTDAAAVQFPAEAGTEVPAICMGQADRAVNIWQWRADLQSPAPGLPEGAYVDMYQFEDDLYYTAREAGNPLSQEGRPGIQNLLAGGFGTLEATDNGGLQGRGSYHDGRWAVVFARPLQPEANLQPDFDEDSQIDVALAVWDGSQGERDGIKSVSAFTRLSLTPEDPPRRSVPATGDWPAYSPTDPMLMVAIALVLVVAVGLVGTWVYWSRKQRPSDG
jgi:complex iron-sulfur molybdoenzyme family reductase subunit gamma